MGVWTELILSQTVSSGRQ